MYLRPRTIFQKFAVAEKVTELNDIGRTTTNFKPNGEILFGVVSITTQVEIEKWKALHHEVSHTIVQRGGYPKAKAGDLLINDGRKFLVQAIENVAGMGQWYYYMVLERSDL